MKTDTLHQPTKAKGPARPLTEDEKMARAAAQVVNGESTFFYSLRRRKNEDAFVCALADRYASRGFQPVAAVNVADTKHALVGEAWFICRPDRGTQVLGVVAMNGPGQ